MTKFSKIIIATLVATGFGAITLTAQATTANAKTRTLLVTKYYPSFKVKAWGNHNHIKGYMYTSRQLNKRAHKLSNYAHTTFKVSTKVKLLKSNHRVANYYYIKSANGKIKGYIWKGYTYRPSNAVDVSKSSNTNKPVSDTPTDQKSNDNSADKSSNNGDEKAGKFNFKIDEYRQTALADLNKERAKRNLAPVTEDPKLDQLAQTRAEQIVTHYSHYDDSGNIIAKQLAPEQGITNWSAECNNTREWDSGNIFNNDLLTGSGIADNDVTQYIYGDASGDSNNNGHKHILLDAHNKTVGFGGVTKSQNGKNMFFTSMEFGD